MHKRKNVGEVLRRVWAFACGATLLQVGGCAIDETLLEDFANLALETLLAALTGTV